MSFSNTDYFLFHSAHLSSWKSSLIQQLPTSDNVQEKKPWEKYLYPHPKTDGMKLYNSVVQDIHMSTSGSFKQVSYLREQQSFRWDVHVCLEKLSQKVAFYLTIKQGELQEHIKRLLTVENDLNKSLLLSRSRVQLDQTSIKKCLNKEKKEREQKKSENTKKEEATLTDVQKY